MATGTQRNLFYCRMLSGMVALLCACPGLQERAVAGNVYDKPLEVRHVSLKPDPLNPQVKLNFLR
ncbi:MAG: hypothetical protein ABSG91_17905 [Syntrophobacteraceae bacterium]|jgi:hypothetical protein